MNNSIELSPSITGAVAELKACAWLLKNGYEVFRNVSATGKADLVAYKDDELILIDVTTGRFKRDGITHAEYFSKEKKAYENNIKVLYVYNDYCIFSDGDAKTLQLKCVICNNLFSTNRKRQKTCSYGCRLKYKKEKRS